MSRWSHDLVEVHMQILRRAGEPIPTSQINQEAEKIFSDEWSESTRINLSMIRTALRELGILSHPNVGFWGLMPDAEDRLAPLKGLTDDEVYKEYEKLKHRK